MRGVIGTVGQTERVKVKKASKELMQKHVCVREDHGVVSVLGAENQISRALVLDHSTFEIEPYIRLRRKRPSHSIELKWTKMD